MKGLKRGASQSTIQLVNPRLKDIQCSALSTQHSNHIGDPFPVRFNELTFFEYLKLVRLQRNLGKYQSSSGVDERIAQKATIHNRSGPNYR